MVNQIASNIENERPGVAPSSPRRVAVYGGSFDPVHQGHIAIAHALFRQFELDEFVFIPAFHAPHKVRLKPTSAYDRYAMLCLATKSEHKIAISKLEIEMPERPYSVETLARLNAEWPGDDIFFVMGADSWMDITTWREWEKVLSLSNHIVVTRPGVEIGFEHVTDEIRSRIVDLRGRSEPVAVATRFRGYKPSIVFTDSVNLNISATDIRRKIRGGDVSWREDVPAEVANYVEKYQIYK
ncbi:MAG: nicotinate-nucleotide adenylyltransferase [Pyrinomonadaceae bacterium]